MKTMFLVLSLIGSFAIAKTKTTLKVNTETLTQKTAKAGQLGTSFRLNGSTLRGKLPSSGGSTVSVEGDKFLEDLIGARKDFSDREKSDLERQ